MPDVIGGILDGSSHMTKLNPEQERRYQVWRAMLPQHLQYDGDYDLRGAYSDGLKPSQNEHFDDTYKLPNHPTFSTGSRYSTPDRPGGEWIGDDKKGWTFKASPANLVGRSPEELHQYFQQVEPNSKLILPTMQP